MLATASGPRQTLRGHGSGTGGWVDVQYRTSLHGEDETQNFANAILPWIATGDCLLLSGVVGAGKSVFARALIQAQMRNDGAMEDVPSPTFTLVQVYETQKGPFWHADLYRLSATEEIEELGLIDAMANAITIIEWPERLGDLTPERHLALHFDADANDPDLRHLSIVAYGDGWNWLDRVL